MRKIQGIAIGLIVLPLLIWTVDSAIDTLLIGGHGFSEFWLHPSPDEAKSRILISLILAMSWMVFLLGWQKMFQNSPQSPASDDQYVALVETSLDNVVIHRHNRILFANRNTLDFFGVASCNLSRLARSSSLIATWSLMSRKNVSSAGSPLNSMAVLDMETFRVLLSNKLREISNGSDGIPVCRIWSWRRAINSRN